MVIAAAVVAFFSSFLDTQHIAEAAKEGDSKTKDGDRDGDRGVAGTLLGSGDFRADKVGDGVAAALGCNLLDHDCVFGWRDVVRKEENTRSAKEHIRKPKQKSRVTCDQLFTSSVFEVFFLFFFVCIYQYDLKRTRLGVDQFFMAAKNKELLTTVSRTRCGGYRCGKEASVPLDTFCQ